MRRHGLFFQTFLSMLAVSLTAIAASALLARVVIDTAFTEYVFMLGGGGRMGPGSGVGREALIGSAEQTFLAGLDRAILFGALIAIILAAVAAWLLARRLTSPLRALTVASRALAAGDLAHRVEVTGSDEAGELAEAFNEMAASLAEGEVLRQRLVSDVAHELRNPVAVLRAQIEGMADGVLPVDQARLGSLVDDIGTLSRLVDDLQELSIAEAGRLRYERQPFDLAAVLRAEADRVAMLVRPGVATRVDEPGVPVIVDGDEFRVAQVVRNLLSNAARHTRRGEIVLSVAIAGSAVRVTVSDTGEGIAATDLPYIWERFYRADAARAAETGGAGVGLAISRRIVEDHGGSVFASSAPGSGSAIGFTLPLPAAS